MRRANGDLHDEDALLVAELCTLPMADDEHARCWLRIVGDEEERCELSLQ
jgi:hypothetical protein